MPFTLRSARFLAAEIMEKVIREGDSVIDATMGNGHDTLKLAELVGPDGHVTGFDIQPEAVERTRDLLAENGVLQRCELYAVGHEHMPELVRAPVRMVIFNLGWLPGGDKHVTTKCGTTLSAVDAALELLEPEGVCTVCVYPGHEEGEREREMLTEHFAHLRPQEFNVLHQVFVNAGPGAPECFVIQKQ
ncbi:MAG: class I SAM-dependent methyltransferase [Clostridia bacterium]|nr:class I SAM-dependent methyltransferase [Clostridia bacterium]